MHEFTDDPILAAGYEYWLSLPRKSDIPDRGDIDPTQMPRNILANVALLEILDDGLDALVRLAGQQFDEHFGMSLKGKRASYLVQGDYRDYILSHYRKLVEERKPIYSESAFRWDDGGHMRTRRLMMPLSNGDPSVVAMVFKLQTWPREEMRGLPFCEVVANSSSVSNSGPRVVDPKSG